MKKLFLILVISTLSACSTTKTEVVETTKYIIVEPDDVMLQKCPIQKPPAKDDYLNKSVPDREQKLYEYAMQLMKGLSECNSKLEVLKQWIDKQKVIYQSGGKNE